MRSEEHTSELQSHLNLVCRLLLEKKKIDEQLNDLLNQLKEAQRKQDNSLELEIAQKVIALRRKKF